MKRVTLAFLLLSFSSPALAEEEPTPGAPPAAQAPAAAQPAFPAPTADNAPAPAAEAVAGPADSTLFRVDIEDGFAIHPWIYHEERLSNLWGILVDANAQAAGVNPRFPPYAELDVGPVLHLGDLQINPQLGFDITYKEGTAGGQSHFGDVIAELYLIYSEGRVNAESWNLYFFPLQNGTSQFFLTRQLVTARVVGDFSIGPHFEATWVRDTGVDRMAYGGDLAYGADWGQLTLFLADSEVTVYPPDAGPNGRKQYRLENRLTFVRAF